MCQRNHWEPGSLRREELCRDPAGAVRTTLQGGLLVWTRALLPRVLRQDGERRVAAAPSFRSPRGPVWRGSTSGVVRDSSVFEHRVVRRHVELLSPHHRGAPHTNLHGVPVRPAFLGLHARPIACELGGLLVANSP